MQLRKTVAYIGGFELPDRNPAAHRVLTNAKLLRQLGFSVVLIGVTRESPHITKQEWEGFPSYGLPYPESGFTWLQRYFRTSDYLGLLEEIPAKELAAVILYNEKCFLQYTVSRWAARRGVKVIFDVTEWYAHNGWGLSTLFKKLDGTLRMHVMNKRADGLITTSAWMSDFYSNRGFARQAIVELPTLFDHEIASSLLKARRAPRNSRGLRLVYSGTPFDVRLRRLRPRHVKERLDQVIDVFIEIRAHRPAVSLDVFGVTETQFLRFYPSYRSIVESCGAALRFHGAVPHRTVLEHIADSHFSIFFRDRNRVTLAGFPTKFSESITYGTPVITNLAPSIEKYVVRGTNCLIVDPQDPKQVTQLANQLSRLSDSDIASIKDACHQLRSFDFRRYTGAVGTFVTEMGLLA